MDKPESSRPNIEQTIRKAELLSQFIKIQDEIKFRKERLNYNIFAGVTKKSIEAQKQTISELELQKDIIEIKYAYE